MVDYGIGNLRSADKALEHLGAESVLTADVSVIRAAAGVVLPGVGAFGACMDSLRAHGLAEVTAERALDDRPFLGICVGMQMLFEGSDESPGVEGLGVLPGRVERLPGNVTLPQMGWNTMRVRPGSLLCADLPDPAWLYFVHSFAVIETDSAAVVATARYGTDFVAAIEKGALWATQFHPEKSSTVGLALLTNFVKACA